MTLSIVREWCGLTCYALPRPDDAPWHAAAAELPDAQAAVGDRPFGAQRG